MIDLNEPNVTEDVTVPRADIAAPALRHDAAAVIAFLKWLDFDGRHNLWALHPETEAKSGQTFARGAWEKIGAFVETHQGFNVYYSANEPRPGAPDDRLTAEDIAFTRLMFIDCDPDKQMETEGESGKARDIARTNAHDAFSNQGSAIVDTGGGFQVLWRLKEKLAAQEHGIACTSQNRGLTKRFAGDKGVIDTPRVLRAPGTVNWPNKSKRERGRRPAMASVQYGYDRASTADKVSMAALAAIAAPIAAPAGVPEKDLPRIDMAAVNDVACYGDLPELLREKFSYDCDADEVLKRLWDGHPAPRQQDHSGSGNSTWLAAFLKRTGRYTPDEFGQLLMCWGHASAPEKIDERYISRAWGNAPQLRIESSEGFEDIGDPYLHQALILARQLREARSGDNAIPEPMSLRELDARPVAPVRELVAGLIEKGVVTFLSSPGGNHKSRVAVQWGRCINEGMPIFGRVVEKAALVYLSYEDDIDEVTRRSHKFVTRLELPQADSGTYWNLAGLDAPLAIVEEAGACNLQPFWFRLHAFLRAIPGHKFIVADGTYNVLRFAGQAKINETSVMAAIRTLQRLCDETDSTLLALWHPSQAGQERGDASGWSVAWHNAPRARLSLTAKEKDAFELKVEKRNHGAKGEPMTLYFADGVLLPRTGIAVIERGARDEQAVIQVAIKAAEKGIPITSQRHLSSWQLDEIAEHAGDRISNKDAKEILATAVAKGLLSYLKGSTRRMAGYYPPGDETAAELARNAKRTSADVEGKTGCKTGVKPGAKARAKAA